MAFKHCTFGVAGRQNNAKVREGTGDTKGMHFNEPEAPEYTAKAGNKVTPIPVCTINLKVSKLVAVKSATSFAFAI